MQMLKPLKLISLNVEEGKHFALQIPFLESASADILCLQEIPVSDFHKLKDKLGVNGEFTPTWIKIVENDAGQISLDPIGIGILSKHPLKDCKVIQYADAQEIRNRSPKGLEYSEKVLRVFMVITISTSYGKEFSVANIHFTWSPNGVVTSQQRAHLNGLMQVLEKIPEIILCGDFNSPRGGEIFDTLALKYRDNIPKNYKTSIDGNLHRAGRLELMVDGLFSTPKFIVSHVELISGLSDHCAILADLN
jgi:endonuclease/exonuclease/phosphatase family metal-dependent hydrolase